MSTSTGNGAESKPAPHETALQSCQQLFNEAMNNYRHYYSLKRQKQMGEATKVLHTADELFEKASKAAVTGSVWINQAMQRFRTSDKKDWLKMIASDLHLMHARCMSCRVVTRDAMRDYEAAYKFGKIAVTELRRVGDIVREYQTLNNMFLPTLKLFIDRNDQKYLLSCIENVSKMINIAQRTEHVVTPQRLAAVRDRYNNLCCVRDGIYTVHSDDR